MTKNCNYWTNVQGQMTSLVLEESDILKIIITKQ